VDLLVDPLYGSGATWIPRLLQGGRIRITELHSERNPYFGGVNPEPIPPNVDEALRTIAQGRYDLGLLLDGDADRSGAADERGTFITTLQIYALLMYYLVEHRGLREPVVKTVNETSMAERLGERYGVDVYEVPVGFKYVGPKMIETGAMMGGEESGGFGFGMHLPERDGIFTDLMLLDLFLCEKEAGRWPASRAIAHLHEIAGPSSYRRVDVHFDRAVYPELKDRLLVELPQKAPTELAGRPVVRTQTLTTNDGFKFFADDGSWLLIRFSGTEPLHGGRLGGRGRCESVCRRGHRPRRLTPGPGATRRRPAAAPALSEDVHKGHGNRPASLGSQLYSECLAAHRRDPVAGQ
jgi:phosphomannomutase